MLIFKATVRRPSAVSWPVGWGSDSSDGGSLISIIIVFYYNFL